jgi:hypothetical protein
MAKRMAVTFDGRSSKSIYQILDSFLVKHSLISLWLINVCQTRSPQFLTQNDSILRMDYIVTSS